MALLLSPAQVTPGIGVLFQSHPAWQTLHSPAFNFTLYSLQLHVASYVTQYKTDCFIIGYTRSMLLFHGIEMLTKMYYVFLN